MYQSDRVQYRGGTATCWWAEDGRGHWTRYYVGGVEVIVAEFVGAPGQFWLVPEDPNYDALPAGDIGPFDSLEAATLAYLMCDREAR